MEISQTVEDNPRYGRRDQEVWGDPQYFTEAFPCVAVSAIQVHINVKLGENKVTWMLWKAKVSRIDFWCQ